MSGGVTAGVREVGDSALVLQVGSANAPLSALDPAANVRAASIARAVRRRAIAGVRDVAPTYRSVIVSFDPLSTDVAAIDAALREEADTAPDVAGRSHEVPVEYGGEAGPDLEMVAAFAGCSPREVIERHASRPYRVCMLGFLPGFPYMASVDETIAIPRRETPRLRVPAGSVGIAGRQTGIYPFDSPGGWQIVGRTGVTLFDPLRMPPALFAPGDVVRFVPVRSAASSVARTAVRSQPVAATGAGRWVTVLRPGLLTTVQDSGRWGYQEFGVPVSGPMDRIAHRLANAIAGNAPDAATLEVTWLGPELRLDQQTRVALAGGDLQATLDRTDLPLHAAVTCRAGSVLRFGDRRAGARVYIAFDGGIAVPAVLGSRATHVRSGLGGVDGRPLRAGDRLPLGHGSDAVPTIRTAWPPPPSGGARLRMLPGPQVDHFLPSVLDALQRTRYTISPESDRMGYRLSGGSPVWGVASGEMISDAAFTGGLQLPPSGDPILLMADRPTTGGYPQVGVVISADLPVAAQLAAGDWVEFEVCSRAEAIAALVAQEGRLLALR